MQTVLVKIAETTWVNPTKVVAIQWCEQADCPMILTAGGKVLATRFGAETSQSREGCTDDLIDALKVALIAALDVNS